MEILSFSLEDIQALSRHFFLDHFSHMNTPSPKSVNQKVCLTVGKVTFSATVVDFGTQFYSGVDGAPNFFDDVTDGRLLASGSAREESRCAVLCLAVGTKLNIHPFLLLAAFRFVGSRIEQEGCRDSVGDVDFAAADVLSSFMVRANEMDLHILNLIDFEELRDRTVVGSY